MKEQSLEEVLEEAGYGETVQAPKLPSIYNVQVPTKPANSGVRKTGNPYWAAFGKTTFIIGLIAVVASRFTALGASLGLLLLLASVLFGVPLAIYTSVSNLKFHRPKKKSSETDFLAWMEQQGMGGEKSS